MNIFTRGAVLFVLAAFGQSALAQGFLYNGHAAAIVRKSGGATVETVAEAGWISRILGGEDWASASNIEYQGVVEIQSATAYVNGQSNQVVAQSKLSGIRVASGVPGAPDVFSATSIGMRAFDKHSIGAYATATFEGVTINGVPVTVSSRPNQHFWVQVEGIGPVHIILNTQRMSKTLTTIQAIAVRIVLPSGDAIHLAQTTAGMVPEEF